MFWGNMHFEPEEVMAPGADIGLKKKYNMHRTPMSSVGSSAHRPSLLQLGEGSSWVWYRTV